MRSALILLISCFFVFVMAVTAGCNERSADEPNFEAASCPSAVCSDFDTPGNCDSDSEGDCICEPYDNCPGYKNCDQADNDNDGVGNPCDPTPNGEDFAAIGALEARLDVVEAAVTAHETRLDAVEASQAAVRRNLLMEVE